MSDEIRQRRLELRESDKPVRSMVTLLCVLGVVWAVGRQVVPYFRENVPLFMLEEALIAVECAVLLYWAFRAWRLKQRTPSVADGTKFILLATGFAIGLWFLTQSYLVFEVEGFSSAAILAMAIVAVLVWYLGRWVARFYWDTKLRLALLEEIVKQQGFDPEQLRRDFYAQIPADDPSRRSRIVRSVVGSELRSPN